MSVIRETRDDREKVRERQRQRPETERAGEALIRKAVLFSFLLVFPFPWFLAWFQMSVGGLTQRSTKPRKGRWMVVSKEGRRRKGEQLDTTVRFKAGERINE